MRFFIQLLCFTLLPLLAVASQPYQMPAGAADHEAPDIVAGYRAIFTCSAHFFAGRPLKDILKVELVDVQGKGFPDPVIDEKRQLVFASDPQNIYRRIAAYRPDMGCTLLPPHWQLSDVPRLPNVAYAPAPDVSALAFPAGDKVGLPANGVHPSFTQLEAVLVKAFDGVTYAKVPGTVTTAVLVIKRDKQNHYKLIAERYRPGFGIRSGYRTWSTAKSISAALLAIASHQGILELDKPVAIPEWPQGDPRRSITYKQLMHMSSGLYSGGANSAAVYFGGQDVVSAATGTPLEVNPGTRWKYANNDTLLLMRSLRHLLADD